jgi:hypothetical protein
MMARSAPKTFVSAATTLPVVEEGARLGAHAATKSKANMDRAFMPFLLSRM